MTRGSAALRIARTLGRTAGLAALLVVATMMGCETDSFFDPSKTGRFEYMPTTIPILERIDAIEARERLIQDTTPVTPEDLLSNDLTYRLSPGDMVTVEIPELTQPGTMYGLQRRIDSTGLFRIARIGDVPAAGLTAEELEAEIRARLVPIMADADVSVLIDEGIGFQYTVYGLVRQVGVYPLRKPDLRIREAMAMAGGLPDIVTTVYVIRTIPLVPGLEPFPRTQVMPQAPIPPGQAVPPTQPPPVDVEELIRQLDKEKQTAPPQPGVLRTDGEPTIDVDELQPAGAPRQPAVDVDDPTRNASPAGPGAGQGGMDTFVFIEERGEWVRVKRGPEGVAQPQPVPAGSAEPPTMLERIIAIPAKNIREGDAAYNIVVRPNDSIYVREPPSGFVYVDGEVIRPGVYSLPPDGKLTMSRLVTAAGGLNPVAIPERVDLTRVVGPNREATLRVNLAGIRRRTEPDVYLKPDDHIIVGTNFLAVPLAVIRSGFRTTYGFGFLLDRNFGNDVFGPPPVNQFGQ